jgi:16S rRNA (cytosine967-C5)-methyltransferase
LYQKIGSPIVVQGLDGTASADLRVNMADRQSVKKRLQSEGLFFSETPFSPYGLRSEERVNLNNCMAYHEGLVEVQDESCQIGALLCRVRADEKTIDYCAGAGGKSLAIAAYCRNNCLIEAYDKNWNRMDALKARATRLGIRSIRLISDVTDTDYDCFIVDAPCSGSGTWRRSPDAKFRLTPEKLAELHRIQTEILDFAYRHTKSGGRIVYMTCSVLPDENERIIEAFLGRYSDLSCADHEALWQSVLDRPYPFNEKRFIRFAPHTTHTDGFFFCCVSKK